MPRAVFQLPALLLVTAHNLAVYSFLRPIAHASHNSRILASYFGCMTYRNVPVPSRSGSLAE